jgi:integrase/recombinase XerD
MNTHYKSILTEFVNWVDTLGYSNSLKQYCYRSVRDFFQWLEEKQIQNINLINNKQINDYFNYLETRPNWRYEGTRLSPVYLNHNFLAIDKLLEFLHQYGMENVPIPTNNRIKIDQQERINKIEILTQDEIKTLYDCIPDTYQNSAFKKRQQKQYELKLIFALFYACGLRRNEGYNLCFKDVDFDKRTIFVHQGKNYKDRVVPMSEGAYRELQDYIYNFRHKLKLNHSRLFISSKITLTRSLHDLQQISNDPTIKAKHLTLHILRHSIATHLLQNGVSIENISLFLGHSSLVSTQTYTHVANFYK